MFHYCSKITLISIVLIFYFKNSKSVSLGVPWALVSDSNFKPREGCAVEDVDPQSSPCMSGVSAQVTHPSDTTAGTEENEQS